MNKIETAKILAAIQEYWPRFMDGRDVEHTVNAWHLFFDSDDYKFVEAALKAYICTDAKGFPPTVGQIKDIMQKMSSDEQSETQAWAIVQKAVTRCRNAEQEFNNLPFEIQKCVGSPQMLRVWGQMDEETFASVVASNFMRDFRKRMEWMRDYQKLPDSVKKICATTAEMFRLPDASPTRDQKQENRTDNQSVEEEWQYSAGPPPKVQEQIKALRERLEQAEKQRNAKVNQMIADRFMGNANQGIGGGKT